MTEPKHKYSLAERDDLKRENGRLTKENARLQSLLDAARDSLASVLAAWRRDSDGMPEYTPEWREAEEVLGGEAVMPDLAARRVATAAVAVAVTESAHDKIDWIPYVEFSSDAYQSAVDAVRIMYDARDAAKAAFEEAVKEYRKQVEEKA